MKLSLDEMDILWTKQAFQHAFNIADAGKKRSKSVGKERPKVRNE